MTEPLLSEARLRYLLDQTVRTGGPTLIEAMRQAVRETAEVCARVADEVGCTRLAEFHDSPAMAEGIAAEIRRRMGE